jgi:segregation and condensation protein A
MRCFMPEYKVQFEVFEGPMDLLLYLIKKEEVDIYAVNLTKLATQFLEYVELMRQFDLEVAGEFLAMASTLMYLKSRELLPVDQQAVVEGEEEEGEDPRWELIRQLVEYKKFKDAAAQLQVLEARQENIYPRVPGKIEFQAETAPAKPEAGIFDLLNAVSAILKRFDAKAAGTREIYEDRWTVSEKIEVVLHTIAEGGNAKFSELFEKAANRAEVICTFLALLELIRLKQIVCVQPEPFGEIEIRKAENLAPAAAAAAEEAEANSPSEAAPAEAPPAEAPSVPAAVTEEPAPAETPAALVGQAVPAEETEPEKAPEAAAEGAVPAETSTPPANPVPPAPEPPNANA